MVKMKKMYCIICSKDRNLKNFENIFTKKTLVLSIICSKCGSEIEKIFKEEE